MRPRRLVAARAAAVLAAAALTLSGLVAAAGPASAATTTPPTLVVAPRDGGLVTADGGVTVDVRVSNPASTALPAGDLAFSVSTGPVASTTTLLESIADQRGAFLGFLLPGVTARTPSLDPGGAATVSVRLTRKDLLGTLSEERGASLLYVRLSVGADVRVVAQAALTRPGDPGASTVGVTVAIPLTAPATTTGIVDTAAQDRLAAPGGAWDDALRAARADPDATVLLDPAVLASIRLAGDDAPPDATGFLDGLDALPNPFVRLPYADGDETLTRAAGADGPVAPSSFAGASAAAPAGASGSASPSPTPAATAAAVPAAAALTAWHWASTSVAWPVPRSTSSAALAAMGSGGTRVLLGTGDVTDSRARATAGPRATVAGTRVLVADERIGALLDRAAAGGVTGDAALASLVGALGTDAVSGEAAGLLLVPGRTDLLPRLGAALSVLRRASFVRGVRIDDLASGGAAPAVRLKPAPVRPDRVATAQDLLQRMSTVADLGDATPDGRALIAPERLALAGALSAAWRADDGGWRSAASTVGGRLAAFASQVQIPPGSDITYLGTDGILQVPVRNQLHTPVSVVVRGTSSNGRLQITGSTRVTVPGDSSRSAKLPIRSIANGRSQVTLRLTTASGTVIGGPATRTITIRAGFESVVAVLLIVALGLLFLTGIYRNVIRRRRRPERLAR